MLVRFDYAWFFIFTLCEALLASTLAISTPVPTPPKSNSLYVPNPILFFSSIFFFTLATQDVNKEAFVEVWGNENSNECQSDMSFGSSQHVFYSSTQFGTVYRIDTREKPSEARSWDLHEKKIGCVDVNPADDGRQIVTSSNGTY